MISLPYKTILNDIEKIAKKPDSNYIDAVLEYAHRNDIEVEALGDLISKVPAFKSHIQEEAEDLKLLERISRLPI
jgi:hypothetical protein